MYPLGEKVAAAAAAAVPLYCCGIVGEYEAAADNGSVYVPPRVELSELLRDEPKLRLPMLGRLRPVWEK